MILTRTSKVCQSEKKHCDPILCDMVDQWPDTSGHKCWTYHSGPEDFNNLLMKFCREFSILQVYDVHHHDNDLDKDDCNQNIFSTPEDYYFNQMLLLWLGVQNCFWKLFLTICHCRTSWSLTSVMLSAQYCEGDLYQ